MNFDRKNQQDAENEEPCRAGISAGGRIVMRADCAFGAFYRRMKSRLGPAQAIVATAHLIARVVYRMLKDQEEYQSLRLSEYEKRYHDRQIKYLEKTCTELVEVKQQSSVFS